MKKSLLKIGLFKSINSFMVVACMFTMAFNFVNTRVLTTQKAYSQIDKDTFNFEVNGSQLSFSKNDKLINKIDMNKNVFFDNKFVPFQNDALVVAGKAVAAGFAAAATGGSFGAAVMGVIAQAAGQVGGAVMAGAAVGADIGMPGAAAVGATLGGAGEVAAAAAAADAAALAGASAMSIAATIIGPALVAAGIFGGVA